MFIQIFTLLHCCSSDISNQTIVEKLENITDYKTQFSINEININTVFQVLYI
jgi:hypothetical protein